MSGRIQVHIPEVFRLPLKCVIKVGATVGLPGDLLFAPAGEHEVVVKLAAELALLTAAGTITFRVRVEDGRTTEVYLRIVDWMLRTSGPLLRPVPSR